MPETNDMTCQVCFGKFDDPRNILVPGDYGPTADVGITYISQDCPADCHNPENWKALERLVANERVASGAAIESMDENETLRTRIADLVQDRERLDAAERMMIERKTWQIVHPVDGLPGQERGEHWVAVFRPGFLRQAIDAARKDQPSE